MDYNLVYTNRKSIGIYIGKGGRLEVRCPRYITKRTIEEVLVKKKNWIDNARKKIVEKKELSVNDDERIELINKAHALIPSKVKYFSEIMGVTPKSIRIGNAKSYWGCCSGDNRLNFSWRLMKMNDKVIDYVVVHELAHIIEHNHSKRFWDKVQSVVPDYENLREELSKYSF